MRYWIEVRHPEKSSPLHPTKFEEREGARLYLDDQKAERVKRKMSAGDKIFFYETATNERDASWRGASSIGALVTVDSEPYHRPDDHENSRTGRREAWKVDARWDVFLRDWSLGVTLDELRPLLGYKPGWAPRTLLEISRTQYVEIYAELIRCKAAAGSVLRHAIND